MEYIQATCDFGPDRHPGIRRYADALMRPCFADGVVVIQEDPDDLPMDKMVFALCGPCRDENLAVNERTGGHPGRWVFVDDAEELEELQALRARLAKEP